MLLWPHPLQSVEGRPWKARVGRVKDWPSVLMRIVASLAMCRSPPGEKGGGGSCWSLSPRAARLGWGAARRRSADSLGRALGGVADSWVRRARRCRRASRGRRGSSPSRGWAGRCSRRRSGCRCSGGPRTDGRRASPGASTGAARRPGRRGSARRRRPARAARRSWRPRRGRAGHGGGSTRWRCPARGAGRGPRRPPRACEP